MRIQICAVGRLRSGPERQLLDTYAARIDAVGRGIGMTSLSLHEVEEKKALEGMALREREATLLLGAMPKGATLVALDERGKAEPSTEFAARLGQWRDQGTSDLCFLIGGADGFAPALRERADHLMALGPMTWPHMLVRVMLAEQIYRAITILSGHPYHRV
ncbi:MAG: 23S rRNA (pseudouridine(1915)-N(3))-methyltransferase RlmH [Rhizobiales bacterium]|nr:23S rRNA (pseudouridine(1915)-N(3))-methyltransferase RlmH [Hyphomicrobiales bacterium]